MTESLLPIAVRAYTVRHDRKDPESPSPRPSWAGWPEYVLLLDTETTTDATQRLLFGSYRFSRWSEAGRLQGLEEGLFYADELPETDPKGFACLQEYARVHPPEVAAGVDARLQLRSRAGFLREVFWPAAFECRALVVGFNLPFDLSRLAYDAGKARGWFHGGFSFVFAQVRDTASENRHWPRVRVKHLDSKRAFIGFTRIAKMDREHRIPEGSADAKPDPQYTFRGHFLDLRTLAFALTDQSHSLASACEAFGAAHGKEAVQQHGQITTVYVDYNRRDVLATQELLEKLRAEFDQHQIDLDPCKAYSPASIAKAYLRAMQVALPTVEFTDDS